MPISTTVKTKRDGTILIAALAGGAFDLTTGALLPGAESLEIAYETGDLNWSVPRPVVNNFLDRGEVTDPPSVRFGDDQMMTWSFSAFVRDMVSGLYASVEQIAQNAGYVAANWEAVNASAPGCAEVPLFDARWIIDGASHCDPVDYYVILRHNFFVGSFAEGDPNALSMSATSYTVYPTVIAVP